jgi:hypothetical protein
MGEYMKQRHLFKEVRVQVPQAVLVPFEDSPRFVLRWTRQHPSW